MPDSRHLPARLESDLAVPLPDAEQVDPRMQRLIVEAAAPETRRAYRRDWADYTRWCASIGVPELPITSTRLVNYAGHLMDRQLAPKTIKRYLATCQTAHHTATGKQVSARAALRALVAYGRQRAADGTRDRGKAHALNLEEVRAVCQACDTDTNAGLRDRLVVLLGITTFRRRHELAGVDIDDITISPEGMSIYIAKSKTDQAAIGATVDVLYGNVLTTCPVRTAQAWIGRLADHGIDNGPLLRAVDTNDRIAGTPGYAGRSTGRMSGAGVGHAYTTACRRAGLTGKNLTAHGMRAGGATIASRTGASKADITQQGGWTPNSQIVDGYLRAGKRWENNPMRNAGL